MFNVALNGTDLVVTENAFRRAIDHPGSIGRVVPPDRVITADGYVRDVIVINDQFPGPTLEVMEGSQVNKHGSGSLLNIHVHCTTCMVHMMR